MKIVIVGGGPAGMIAGISASKFNRDSEVIIIEKNEKLGKKLFITGKGRCNVTNKCDKNEFFKNVVRNSKFLFSSFNEFSNDNFMELLEENGCKLKVERGNRVFPLSDKSYDIIDCLKRILKKQNVKIMLNTELIDIKLKNCDYEEDELQNKNLQEKKVDYIIVKNNISGKAEKIKIDKLIIATGGKSYESTGSTGDGYKLAKFFGITVKNAEPSLVPLEVVEKDDCAKMQGLQLKNISIKLLKSNAFNIENTNNNIYVESEKSKLIYQDFGEMTFMDYGLSGPVILSASCYLSNNDFDKSKKDCNYKLIIDLKPALTEKQLDNRLLREFSENKTLKTTLETLLPMDMIDVFINRIFKMYILNEKQSVNNVIDDIKKIKNITGSNIDKSLRQNIIFLLKNFDFNIISKRGFDEAIITRGGIDISEINPKTMESRKIRGLYFAGEVLDVDCLTGGFNIQVAATTGYAAGK